MYIIKVSRTTYSTTILLVFIILASLMPPVISRAEVPQKASQLFFEANQAYEKEEFQKAEGLYQEILHCGLRSGMLYYNLGNCYTKMGEIGKALLYYRKAEQLIPRDGDLRFNLQYVLDQRKDKIESKDKLDLARVFFFWYYWISLREACYLFLIANLIFWSLSLIVLFKQNESFRWIRIIALSLFLILGATFLTKVCKNSLTHSGVVISAEATVRSGNGTNHSPLFILHEGAEFTIDQTTNGWMRICLADGKIGWISTSEAEVI